MRWWTWLISGLIAATVILSLVRQRPQKDGEELLRAMEAKAPLRTAMMVFDYQLEEVELEGAERGLGMLLGGLQMEALVWRGGEFTWRRDNNPLRESLGDGTQKTVAQALYRMGYYDDAVRGAIREAMAQLDAMTDETLFMAWVRADRAMMAEMEELPRAVREGLLLVSRRNGGPVVVFEVRGEVVYLLPLDGANGKDTWVMMEAFRDGRLTWTGTLRLLGHPPPAMVRAIAAHVAREANSTQRAP